ncbi:MAG: hypothetical protein HZC28_10260 [Spirochaetes bacterium]|nr:hypothetical protein [Spirochaetota bacterium]
MKKHLFIFAFILSATLLLISCFPTLQPRNNPLDPDASTVSSNFGKVWKQQSFTGGFTTRARHAATVFKDNIYVIGGWNTADDSTGGTLLADVWRSPDGSNWMQITSSAQFGPRRSFNLFTFDNKMWVIGGYSNTYLNDVWYTADGTNWTLATGAAFSHGGRQGCAGFVYDNKMWILGGDNGVVTNDIYNTTDGATWNLWWPTTPFESLRFGAAFALNGKLAFMYGQDGTVFDASGHYYVSSDNGVNWTYYTGPRGMLMAYTVADNKMWIIGGNTNLNSTTAAPVSTIKTSVDGVSWNEVTTTQVFTGRQSAAAVFFKNRIYLLGGFSGAASLAEVWYTE